jgi:hypothetical protein
MAAAAGAEAWMPGVINREARDALVHVEQEMPDQSDSAFALDALEGVWHVKKSHCRDSIVAFSEKVVMGGQRMESTFVQLILPQLHKFNQPATKHVLLKSQIAYFEGLMMPGMIQDSLSYRLDDYLNQVPEEVIMMDLVKSSSNCLRVRPVSRKAGLHELLHHLRQYLLYYLKDKQYLQYKTWKMDDFMTINTANYRICMPELTLTHGGRGRSDPEIEKMINKRIRNMTWELLHPSLSPRMPIPNPVAFKVEVNRAHWPYLVHNGFLLPKEQCLCIGGIDLPCELLPEEPQDAQGNLPGAHRGQLPSSSSFSDFTDSETTDFTQMAHALAKDKNAFKEDDLVLRHDKPAVVIAVDRSLMPVSYIIRMYDGSEVGCEETHIKAVQNKKWLEKLRALSNPGL